jgi:hypothetical protein
LNPDEDCVPRMLRSALKRYEFRLNRCGSQVLRHCERSEAIQNLGKKAGLLRRCAPRNDGFRGPPT